MKISLMLMIILILLATNRMRLLMVWVVSSEIVMNYIARPHMIPFFGSKNLVAGQGFYSTPGFDFRELFNFERIVLLLLFITALAVDKKRIKYKNIDIVFLIFLCIIFLSTTYSSNSFHSARVALDTFGLCYVAYFLGKNFLYEEQRFEKFLKAILVLGCVLIPICLLEFYTYHNLPLYRITGPFLFWENLGLTLTIIFFVALYKKGSTESKNKKIYIWYNLLIILLLVCILLTLTRTVWAVLIIGLILISIKGKDFIGGQTIRKYYLISIGSLIVISMLIVGTNIYQNRMTARTDYGRITQFKAASRIFLRHPLFGIGLREYQMAKLKYLTPQEIEDLWISERGSCHNSYLVTAAETGLAGLIPLLLVIFFSYKMCQQYYEAAGERKEKLWGLIMIAITVAYFLSAMTFDPFYESTIDNKLYYMLLGATVARYDKIKCSL